MGLLTVQQTPTQSITATTNILKLIRDKFSIKNPNYMARKFADRIYAITPAGCFQIGMWFEIESFIKSLNLPIKINVSDEFQKLFTPSYSFKEIENIEGYNYFDYQEDTLKEFLSTGRGISILATGAGKSVICGGLCKTLIKNKPDIKILISVPNTLLLNQLYSDFFYNFGIECVTKWGDGNTPDLSKNIIIANNQILTSDIDYTLSIVKDFDVVVVDEVHRLGDKKTQIGKVIKGIKTPNKFGLTGTLPEDKMDCWNIIGKIGPIVYEKNSYEIRKKGTITDIEMNVIVCKHQNKPKFTASTNLPTEEYEFEINYLMNNQKRNSVIKKIAHSLDGNVLILVDRLSLGRNLLQLLQTEGRKVYFIEGNTDSSERDRIKNEMENETGIMCIAMTTIFSTGVSINNLHYAIFTLIGKSFIKIIQSIGRTVRKHSSKNKSVIFDIADDLPYSKDHLIDRLRIYKEQKISTKTVQITI